MATPVAGCEEGRKHFSLEQLESMWETVTSQNHKWYRDDGTPNWPHVSGPISALVLSLERIGWSCSSCRVWTDDLGTSRDLLLASPKMFRTFLYQSAMRWNQRQLAQAAGDGSMCGERACVDVVTTYLADSRNTASQRATVAALATNAIWTRRRFADSGYVVPDARCQLCHAADDTLHHRLWHCQAPAAVSIRRHTAKHGLVEHACRAGEGSSLYNYGIFQHPGDFMPRPNSTGMEWMIHDGKIGRPGDGSSPPMLTGYVFSGGHCSCEKVQEANRASWGLVQTDSTGKQQAWVRGTVPDHYQQSAQAAEFLGGLQSMKFTRQAVVYDDCANVVTAFQGDTMDWGSE